MRKKKRKKNEVREFEDVEEMKSGCLWKAWKKMNVLPVFYNKY